MPKTTIKPATYKKLVTFAKAGGGVHLTGTVTGSLDQDHIQAYLDHMKLTDPPLYKSWGSKWKLEGDGNDPTADMDGDDDPTADLDGDDDPTADMEDAAAPLVLEQEEVTVKPARNNSVQVSVDRKGAGINLVPGVTTPVPEVFRLRKPDGFDVELEIFSRSTKFGYILRVPVPTDMRTVHLSGQPYQVDFLALQRDPDGMTEVTEGKRVANLKLITLIELAELTD